MDMPKQNKYPFTIHEKNRHGNWAWYFRRDKKSPRIRLKAEFGSTEFEAEYAAALAGVKAPQRQKKAIQGSIKWLIEQWKLSSDWAQTRPATQRQRENILLHVIEDNGHLTFGHVDEEAISGGMDRRAQTPAAANNYLKTMRALFGWAKKKKHIKTDPTLDVEFMSFETDGHQPWTALDIEAYRGRWPIGTRARLAFEIFFWTGLRRGDANRFGRQHIGENGIAKIRMEKTNENVEFDVPQQLLDVIGASPCGDLSFISRENGAAFTKEGFGNKFREWCRKAGLKKTAHGIRKFAASDAAMNGASEAELRALFGWQTNTQSLLYTKSARNAKLATSALEKRGGNVSFPAPENLSANPKKQGDKTNG